MTTSECLLTPVTIADWYERHKEEFAPPICNRLLHKSQMTVMFVGGPNKRRDFHLDRGSEFFYQMRGNMKLPIILPNKQLRIVEIKQGEVFLLPSCVPHSPQRPEEGSLGLVVERERYADEKDGLRYFVGFDFRENGEADREHLLNVDEILWERFFHCRSLADDLAPVVRAFNASKECETNEVQVDAESGKKMNVFSWADSAGQGNGDCTLEPEFPVNQKIPEVPMPFSLTDFLEKNAEDLRKQGKSIPLFGDKHPDKEFKILVGVPEEVDTGRGNVETDASSGGRVEVDTLVFQVEGKTELVPKVEGGEAIVVDAGQCVVLPPRSGAWTCKTDRATSVALFVQQHPRKNAEFYGY